MKPFFSSAPSQVLAKKSPHPEHTYTSRSAAAYLEISDAWLSALRTRGDGPRFIQVGARYWYSKPDLDQWRERNIDSLPTCRILSEAPTRPLWFEPMSDYDSEQRAETIYVVALPPSLATEKNRGYGYLVVAPG